MPRLSDGKSSPTGLRVKVSLRRITNPGLRSTTAATLLAAALVVVSACRPDPLPGESNASTGVGSGGQIAEATDAPDPILGSIRGRALTMEEFERRMQLASTSGRLLLNTPQGRGRALDMMIALEVMAGAATDAGLAGGAVEALLVEDATARSVLQDLASREVNRGLIPDEEVRAWWEAHRAEFDRIGRSRVSTIVLETQAEAEAVRLSVQEALDSGREGPEWIVKRAVSEWSIDPETRAAEGLLGYVAAPEAGSVVNPEIARVVFAVTERGLAIEVVQTARGWEVLYVHDVVTPLERPFDDVEGIARDRVYAERAAAVQREHIDGGRAAAAVAIDEAALARVRAAHVAQGGPSESIRPRRYVLPALAEAPDVILGVDGVAEVVEEIRGWSNVATAAPGLPVAAAPGEGSGVTAGAGSDPLVPTPHGP